MAVSKEKVKELLGTGLSNETVASAVGCDPAYISQLMSDADFAEQVIALRTASLMDASKQDKDIASIESKLTKRLHDIVDNGQLYKPQDVLRAFVAVNNAKRRGVQITDTPNQRAAVVPLQLPAAVVQQFTINIHGEVVETAGQTLVTMSSTQLLKDLSAKELNAETIDGKLAEKTKYDRVAQFLPTAAVQTTQHGS